MMSDFEPHHLIYVLHHYPRTAAGIAIASILEIVVMITKAVS
jgi:hypothetical protein